VVGEGDLESGMGAKDDQVETHRKGDRRKRRGSTILQLSGGPLADHEDTGAPPAQIQPQDSMTSVERVGSWTSLHLIALTIPQFKQHKFQSTTDEKKIIEFFRNIRKQSSRDTPESREKMKLAEDMSQIYFLNRPELFLRAIEAAIMLNSLYLSLWATNFIKIVADSFDNNFLLQLML
jgi:hypothetical protein